MRAALFLVLGLAAAAASMAGLWRVFGPFGLVFGAPLLGILGWPLVELAFDVPRAARLMAWRREAGRHYAFRGRSLDIHIDDEARCWVGTADARKFVALPADAVLSRLLPDDCGETGDPLQWRVTTEGLATVLAKSTDAEVTKFRDWLEREVARPARNKRARRMLPLR